MAGRGGGAVVVAGVERMPAARGENATTTIWREISLNHVRRIHPQIRDADNTYNAVGDNISASGHRTAPFLLSTYLLGSVGCSI